jgi:hypothetical protein
MFSFMAPYTIGRTPCTGDQQGGRLHNTGTQTVMLRMGFETRILIFERAKTVQALDSEATLSDGEYIIRINGQRNRIIRH